MGWLRLVGSLKLLVFFAKEPYKTDEILRKRSIILRSLLIVATSYVMWISPARNLLEVLNCDMCRVRDLIWDIPRVRDLFVIFLKFVGCWWIITKPVCVTYTWHITNCRHITNQFTNSRSIYTHSLSLSLSLTHTHTHSHSHSHSHALSHSLSHSLAYSLSLSNHSWFVIYLV